MQSDAFRKWFYVAARERLNQVWPFARFAVFWFSVLFILVRCDHLCRQQKCPFFKSSDTREGRVHWQSLGFFCLLTAAGKSCTRGNIGVQ